MRLSSSKHFVSQAGRGTAAVLLVFALAVGFSCLLLLTLPGNRDTEGISSSALYSTRLASLDGRTITLGQWQGKVLLINFWATWCAPCREEVPHLIEAQRRFADKGVQIIGVAVDRADKVTYFAREAGFNYPIAVNEENGIALSKRLGNRAGVLPFTVIVNRQGQIVATVAGALTEPQINAYLQKSM